LVERARKRTVTEGLGSVAALTRIPLINNHLDRHPASPDAAPALLLEGSRGEPPMTARGSVWPGVFRAAAVLVAHGFVGDVRPLAAPRAENRAAPPDRQAS